MRSMNNISKSIGASHYLDNKVSYCQIWLPRICWLYVYIMEIFLGINFPNRFLKDCNIVVGPTIYIYDRYKHMDYLPICSADFVSMLIPIPKFTSLNFSAVWKPFQLNVCVDLTKDFYRKFSWKIFFIFYAGLAFSYYFRRCNSFCTTHS